MNNTPSLHTEAKSQPRPETAVAMFRALSEHSREGILIVDALTHVVLEANAKLGELFDLAPEGLVDRSAKDVATLLGQRLDDPATFVLRLLRFLDLPEASGRMDLNMVQANEPMLVAYVTPIRDAQGDVTAKLWSFYDASTQRALEKSLSESKQSEITARLAAGIVHDSNNLLTIVLGQLSFAAESAGDVPEAAVAMEQAQSAARQCANLLSTVLKMARQEGSRQKELAWETELREVEVMVRAAAPAHVTIHTTYEPDLPLVRANSVKLSQVLMNLAFNAIDAMPQEGELHITLTRQGNDPCLVVRDTGTGIPTPVRQRIFDAFFTTKQNGKGTGLGLHMVAAIVKEHGGTIHCESEPGTGTTFRITLPAVAGDGPSPLQIESSQPEVVSC